MVSKIHLAVVHMKNIGIDVENVTENIDTNNQNLKVTAIATDSTHQQQTIVYNKLSDWLQ